MSWGATTITYVPVQSCGDCSHQFRHFAGHLADYSNATKKALSGKQAGERKFQGKARGPVKKVDRLNAVADEYGSGRFATESL
jgi:hypothetical protein